MKEEVEMLMMNTIAQWMAMQIMKDVWYRVENEIHTIHTENEMCVV